jgi:cellobiose phosphorylase
MKSLERLKTQFGFFADNGKEYVVTTPRTPRPWINVISNGEYGLTISQAGSGYSWRTHAQLNRITRWAQDLIKDEWGKYLYIRDEKGRVWSATWKPMCIEPDDYRCRHGVGYSIIESINFDIRTELLIFVPNDEPLEIWRLNVTNLSRRPRTLDVMSYFEWALGQAPDWHREFHKSFFETSYDERYGAIFVGKRLWDVPSVRGHWNVDWPLRAFHSSSIKPSSFETDKEQFLGMYGTIARPAALKRRTLTKSTGRGIDAIASLHTRLRLQPGETKSVVFTLGAVDSRSDAKKLCKKYASLEAVEIALQNVQKRWNTILTTVEVNTPDPAMDVMQNVWLKYQAISGRMWGRTAYYQTGGAYGFRDQLQDSQLWLAIEPRRTLEQLRLHARHQFQDGSVYHWWHPITEIGLRTKISDNYLWLPYVAIAYLQETSDFGCLELKDSWAESNEEASLYEHCTRAIDLSLQRMSPRGLPLIGAGDWNDGLSAVGLGMKGESIWLGFFLYRILIDFSEVCRRRGDEGRAQHYYARALALERALNDHAWDGKWYFGATKDTGEKLGAQHNKEGRVWLNPQTWAIISGVADEQRAARVMDVIEKELEVDIGTLLLRPAYTTPDPEIGYLTRYAPGMRENGGVYTHAATWSVIAAAILGRGETAFRLYSKLNPIYRGKQPLRYCAEPYVTAGNIEGPDSASFGRGGWTWYTGSAAWLFRVGLEWILGLRPTFEGLLVDPCIPASWKSFRVRRVFRGATYNIDVENPSRVECGVQELWVDGGRVCEAKGPRNKIIPVHPPGTSHVVRVVMGKAK